MKDWIAAGLVSSLMTMSASGLADTGGVQLTLNVDGIATSEGALMIAVFDSEESWNGGAPVVGIRASVDGQNLTASLGTLPAGRYGIKMFHDINGNGELDTNLMGIPSEPFAFSNNARGRFGPATWDAAVFDLTADAATHSISFD